MSLHGFQQAMADLVMSAEMRAQTVDEPDVALSDYELTPKERRRLIALAGDRGMKAGNLIHNSFRLGMVTETLPKTRAVLGEERFEHYIRDYWRRIPPKNYRYAQEAVRFGNFLLQAVESGELEDPYLEEVVRYELTTLRVLQQKSPAPQLLEFRHHPETLLAALNEPGRDLTTLELEEGEHYLLVRRLASGEMETRPVPPELAAKLMG